MKVIRVVPNVVSTAFAESSEFYAAMFDLEVSVELDRWYLQLMSPDDRRLNVGFVAPSNEMFAHPSSSERPAGVVLTIHVDSVDDAYRRAQRLGAEIARRYGEHEDVVHAIEAHHNEVPPQTIEAVLTQASDACSGGRPGARRRPRRRTQPVSSRMSSVPADVVTPRISSISARVTGWW